MYLISKHKHLKIISFNELKSEYLFNKNFSRKTGIKYIVLPSSSPANNGITFEEICKTWSQLLIKK